MLHSSATNKLTDVLNLRVITKPISDHVTQLLTSGPM